MCGYVLETIERSFGGPTAGLVSSLVPWRPGRDGTAGAALRASRPPGRRVAARFALSEWRVDCHQGSRHRHRRDDRWWTIGGGRAGRRGPTRSRSWATTGTSRATGRGRERSPSRPRRKVRPKCPAGRAGPAYRARVGPERSVSVRSGTSVPSREPRAVLMIAHMEPIEDRHNGATPGSA